MGVRLLSAALMLAASVASADAKLYLATVNAVGQSIKAGRTDVQMVPGTTSASFSVPTSGYYILSFSGECAVDSSNVTLALGFFINNVAISPPLPQMSFCSSDHTTALDNWASHATQVPVFLQAGRHTLKVRVQTLPASNKTAKVWLDDFSTIIHD